MATHFSCDRCGSVHSQARDVKKVSYPVVGPNQYSFDDANERMIDLCQNCCVKLTEFMKAQPRVSAG